MAGTTRITLVQAPVFYRGAPSNALALLTAHLKAAGFPALVHDAGLGISRSLRAQGVPSDHGVFSYLVDTIETQRGRPTELLKQAFDAEAVKILASQPHIVGFTIHDVTERGSLELARRIKALAPRTAILFGGPKCLREANALELLNCSDVDAVAVGEGDRSLVVFARSFEPGSGRLPRTAGFLIKEEGRVFDCGDPHEVEDLDTLPFMDFSGFEMESYHGPLCLIVSRGCVRKCAFCSDIVAQKVYRRMSAERIAEEIRHQLARHPGRRFIRFDVLLINGDIKLLTRLCDLLAAFRLESPGPGAFEWAAPAIIGKTMTPEVLSKMRQGGCAALIYGLETGSQKVLGLMHKHFSVADAERVIRDTKAAGIAPGLFVMVGYPGETEWDFQMTVDFLERNWESIDMINLSVCGIVKGTWMAEHLEELGISPVAAEGGHWSLIDGSNTPAVRQERYDALLGLLVRRGLNSTEPVFHALCRKGFRMSKHSSR